MKFNLQPHKVWLCMPVVVTSLVDLAMTLMGQPPTYWRGEYQSAFEFNPISHWLLTFHPLALIMIAFVMLVITPLVIISLPTKIARIVMVFLVMAQTTGIMNWSFYLYDSTFWVYSVIGLPFAMMIVYAFEKSDESIATRQSRVKNANLASDIS